MHRRRAPSPRLMLILLLTGAVATALAGSLGTRIWWIGTLLAVLGATVSAVVQHLYGRNALDGAVEPTQVAQPVTPSQGASPRSAQRQLLLGGAVVTSAITALVVVTTVLALWDSSDPPTDNNPTSEIASTVCAATPKLDAVMRYDGGPFSWTQIGGPADSTVPCR